MIDLSNDQLQDSINELLNKEQGLNQILEMILNGLMKLERDEFLSQQQDPDNKANGYRPGQAGGYGQELSLRIPRDRLGEFKPVILALLRDQDEQVRRLCFELYSKGLTTRQVGQITERVYGQHYSSSAVSSFNQQLAKKLQKWRQRPLDRRYPVLYIDAIWQKVRREHVSGEAFYVVMGLNEAMQREVLAIANIPSESSAGWAEVLQGLKQRGLEQTELVVADALTGLDEAVHRCFPEARHQKCVTHFKRNLLNKVKPAHKDQLAEDLKEVFLTDQVSYSSQQGLHKLRELGKQWGDRYRHLEKLTSRQDLHYYFTYLDFDRHVQSMIYTTNWIERLNRSFRRTLKIRAALPSPDSALLLLSKVAYEKQRGKYKYSLHSFKYDNMLFPNVKT